MSVNDVPVGVVMAQLDAVQASLVRLDEKIDAKLGDHATRIARLEVERDHEQRQIAELRIHQQQQVADLRAQLQEATTGRRFTVTTAVAVLAVVVAIASLIATLTGA